MQPRPQTLAEVAARADSLARFGRELADWLHTVRTLGSRPSLARTVADAPTRLTGRFAEGLLADATLAAYAEWLSARIRTAPPAWCYEPDRIASEPWFADEGPRARLFALRDTPPAFKRRNLSPPSPISQCASAADAPPGVDRDQARQQRRPPTPFPPKPPHPPAQPAEAGERVIDARLDSPLLQYIAPRFELTDVLV